MNRKTTLARPANHPIGNSPSGPSRHVLATGLQPSELRGSDGARFRDATSASSPQEPNGLAPPSSFNAPPDPVRRPNARLAVALAFSRARARALAAEAYAADVRNLFASVDSDH